jgi:hypothetical protein
MHLQPHRTQSAISPGAFADHPAEVEDPHALDAIAANAEFVARTLRAEVQMRDGVLEHTQRGEEVLVPAAVPGGYGRCANEVQSTLDVAPVHERRLHLGATVDQQDVLRRCQHSVRLR